MRVIITLDDIEYNGLLKDMPLIDDIASVLPIELTFERGGDREYYASMNIDPEIHESCRSSRIERNGLYWFPEWKAFCIVLNDTDISPYSVIHLGDMDDDIASVLLRRVNNVKLKVRI